MGNKCYYCQLPCRCPSEVSSLQAMEPAAEMRLLLCEWGPCMHSIRAVITQEPHEHTLHSWVILSAAVHLLISLPSANSGLRQFLSPPPSMLTLNGASSARWSIPKMEAILVGDITRERGDWSVILPSLAYPHLLLPYWCLMTCGYISCLPAIFALLSSHNRQNLKG